MLQILLCPPTGEITQTQDLAQLRQAYAAPDTKIWLDLEDPGEEEIGLLLDVFHLHPIAVEDVIMDLGVPKIETYDGYTFLALHRLFYNFEQETCEKREFEIFFSDRWIITVHESNLSRTFCAARKNVLENPKTTLARSPKHVLLLLLQLALKDYNPVMEQWETDLEEIEQQILHEQLLRNKSDNILQQILKFKRLVVAMRQSFLPEREILQQLDARFENTPQYAELKPYFRRLTQEVNNLLHRLEALRDHVSSVFEVYAAALSIQMTEASNKLNFVMQRLTIAATIFLPLTFIVGVYGMNFEEMPEFHWRGFYYALWAFMISLTAGMLVFFRRKKWI